MFLVKKIKIKIAYLSKTWLRLYIKTIIKKVIITQTVFK